MKKLNGAPFLLLLLAGIVATSFMLVNGFSSIKDRQTNPSSGNAIAVRPTSDNGHSNLQLKTFSFFTPTPELTSAPCGIDNAKKGNCECIITSDPYERDGVVCENKTNGVCPDSGVNPGQLSNGSSDCSKWNTHLQSQWGCDSNSCIYVKDWSPAYDKYAGDNNPNCPDGHAICWGKPVIYLYPTQDTLVNVNLKIPGIVVASNPVYQNGWYGILAHPDGNLEYNDKTYHELFYESQVTIAPQITSGIFIEKQQLEQSLTEITSKLGLLPNEQGEFLSYWLPKLNKLSTNYIFLSILTPSEKEKVDSVTISPKPTTNIAYLFYFKGVNHIHTVNQLVLPEAPPQRVGFTAVEWGGTIDN